MTAKDYISLFGKSNISFEHIDTQSGPQFYCGTMFCGHSTKIAAKSCWKQRNDVFNAQFDEMQNLVNQGREVEADKFLYSQGFIE